MDEKRAIGGDGLSTQKAQAKHVSWMTKLLFLVMTVNVYLVTRLLQSNGLFSLVEGLTTKWATRTEMTGWGYVYSRFRSFLFGGKVNKN